MQLHTPHMHTHEDLIGAVRNDDIKKVKKILKTSLVTRVKPNAEGNEAIKIAIQNHNVDICKLLVGAKYGRACVTNEALIAAVKTHHHDTCMFAVRNCKKYPLIKVKLLQKRSYVTIMMRAKC